MIVLLTRLDGSDRWVIDDCTVIRPEQGGDYLHIRLESEHSEPVLVNPSHVRIEVLTP